MFGITPEIASDMWGIIPRVRYGEPKHMLWACMFLKLYTTETIHSSLAGCNEKTFRKWAFLYIRLLANANNVSCFYTNFHNCLTKIRFYGHIEKSENQLKDVLYLLMVRIAQYKSLLLLTLNGTATS